MGLCHDYQIFIRYLKKSIRTLNINKEEILQLENIKAKMTLTSEIVFYNINTALFKFKLNE